MSPPHRFPPSADMACGSIARLYQELLQPLTLLPGRGTPAREPAPRPQADSQGPPPQEARRSPWPTASCLERPLPPEAAAAPLLPPEVAAARALTLAALPPLLESRLSRLTYPGLPAALSAMLREVVLAEVRALCWEPRLTDPDPALSPGEQQELRRRLVAHTVLVAEGLLQHYLGLLLAGATPGDPLTPPAFFIHLRGRLLLHCARLLNPQSVRVRLLEDMRQLGAAQRARDTTSAVKVMPKRKSQQAPEHTPEGVFNRESLVNGASVPDSKTGSATDRLQETVLPDQKPMGSSSTTNGVTANATPSTSFLAFTHQDQYSDTIAEGVPATELGISPSGGMSVSRRKLTSFTQEADPNTGSILLHEKPSAKIIRHALSGKTSIMEIETGTNAQGSRPLTGNSYVDSTSLLNMDYFVKLSRPHVPRARHQRAEDLRQIESIQPLDLNKIYHLLPCPKEELYSLRNMPCQAVSTACPDLGFKYSASAKHTKTVVAINMKRCQSLPNLRMGELLSDELGIVLQRCHSHNSLFPLIDVTTYAILDSPADDLRKLLQTSTTKTLLKGDHQLVDADLPPLIGALNHRKMSISKLIKMQKRLLNFREKEVVVSEDLPPSEVQTCPQTDTVYLQIRNKPALKTANMQVSKRIFLDVSEVRKYTPIYNDLLGDIEPSTVSWLDRGLFKGEEMREVYTELRKSIPTEHLQFDQDQCIEPYAINVDLSKCIASSTLTKRRMDRVINTDLSSLIQRKRYAKRTGTTRRTPAHSSRLQQEDGTVNFDDYLKYTFSQDSDYLHVVFHLYDSDDGDDEEKAELKVAAKYEQERKREKEKVVAHLMNMKRVYSPGTWNINTIMFGGLGSSIALENVQPQIEKDEVQNLEFQTDTAAEDEAIQSSLESIWNRLHIPEGARLDMAIKYSSQEFQALIPAAITSWDKATNLIQEREQLLAKLEMLEQTASDPNRFFQKGYEGSFPARKKEDKERKALHFHISKLEMVLFKHLKKMKKMYNDTVTFKGRPYLEKMQWDKTEMLFWLQQERRRLLVEFELKKEQLCAMLPPLHALH